MRVHYVSGLIRVNNDYRSWRRSVAERRRREQAEIDTRRRVWIYVRFYCWLTTYGLPSQVNGRSVPAENGFELSRLDRAIKPCLYGSQIGSKNARTQRLGHSADAALQ